MAKELNAKGDSYYFNGDYDSARIYIDSALLVDSLYYPAYNDRAAIKMHTGYASSEVIADYKKALSINPNSEAALISLARFYYDEKDYTNTVIACDAFNKNVDVNVLGTKDFVEIDDIRNKARKYSTVVNGITVSQAADYLDTVFVLINDHENQQKIIDKIGSIRQNYNNYKGTETYLQLAAMLKLAIASSKQKILDIKRLKEIDNGIGLKSKILVHAELLNSLFDREWKTALTGKEYLGILGLNRMLLNSQLKLKKIKQAESEMMAARKEFKIKYLLND